jgi:hypothetical protein
MDHATRPQKADTTFQRTEQRSARMLGVKERAVLATIEEPAAYLLLRRWKYKRSDTRMES